MNKLVIKGDENELLIEFVLHYIFTTPSLAYDPQHEMTGEMDNNTRAYIRSFMAYMNSEGARNWTLTPHPPHKARRNSKEGVTEHRQ
mmetsp:Transcript_51458/g.61909  ORF Transcript_51458/g.61909 Transcript_51458/m.61909 type:complete len:87 (+) Transcript_51458:2-262(+)